MDNKLKIVSDIIKDNVLYCAMLVLVFVLFFMFVTPKIQSGIDSVVQLKKQEKTLKQYQQQYETLKFQQQNKNRRAQATKDGKIIYEALDFEFSTDASFAPLFELVLDIAQKSGIRIRAIDYNYAPQEDLIFTAKLQGYNVCELNMLTVGTYQELQSFIKTIIKEQYLMNFAEIELTPWENDKKILIAKIKLRLYTRTSIDNTPVASPQAENKAKKAPSGRKDFSMFGRKK